MNVVMIVAYAVVCFALAPLLLDREGAYRAYKSGRIGLYFLVSAIAYFLPLLLGRLGPVTEFISENFWGNLLLILSPPWFIFMVFSPIDERVINALRRVWLFFWIGLIVATLLSMAMGSLASIGGDGGGGLDIDPGRTFADLWDRITDSLSGFWSGLIGVPGHVNKFVNRNLEDSIGENYMGQVDPYTDRDLGVRFTDVRTFASRFRAGDDVVVWADLQGESFKEELDLRLRCYAKDNKGRVYNGTVESQGDDSDRVIISMRERVSASCTIEDLPKGFYEVYFVGAFAFQTWAYAPFYFAPEQTIKDMWAEDLDPAREAGIPSKPKATFTNGPVNLGLSSSAYEQPIPVPLAESADDEVDYERTLPPFGASVINRWADGRVANVRSISLFVPPPFKLYKCDRMDGNEGNSGKNPLSLAAPTLPGYKRYTFGVEGDANSLFESVTCFLGLEDPERRSAYELMGSYDLVMKTFAAKAQYVYIIEKHIRVNVE